MKKLLLVVFVGLLLTACNKNAPAPGSGTNGGAKLDIKIGGKDSTLNVKSGGVYYDNMTWTTPGKPAVQTSAHTIYIANYDLDTTSGATMRKALSAADQMRVELQLSGEAGTTKESPFKLATYSVKADKSNTVRYIAIFTFADGKETKTSFDTFSSSKKTDGEVKITAVTPETVSGEVNLTEGDKSIKGTFTAKLPKK